jgi:hypothetical protein
MSTSRWSEYEANIVIFTQHNAKKGRRGRKLVGENVMAQLMAGPQVIIYAPAT